MFDERSRRQTQGHDEGPAGSCSGEAACEAWDEEEPVEGIEPAPAWDPLWDVFDPYDRHEEPEPDYGDFWQEPNDDEDR